MDSLVEKLSSNHESDFNEGLREVARRADSGDNGVVLSMREAIRIRSGKSVVSFYKPGIVMTRGMDRYTEARARILELARKQSLLEDTELSGSLISAINTAFDAYTMLGVLMEIDEMGKKSEVYAFKLLYNEMLYSLRFHV